VLAVERATARFGERVALDAVSLEVAKGEVVTVLGPSGCGKTTLLRAIAGLQPLDAGRVLLAGADLDGVAPHRRGIGLVFQDLALFHYRDVFGNVAFGLRMQGMAPEPIAQRVGELLELVGLAGYERRPVATLSGGEQQRVALARALAPEPRMLLLDEPLGSLDRLLRDRLLEDLARLFDELGVTAIYVTHDQAEAFALGDRVAVMRDGRIVQLGAPDELWSRPADADLARFIGLRNVEGGEVVRPEAVTLLQAPDAEGDGVVVGAVRHGPTVEVTVRLDDGRELEAAVTALEHPVPGDRVVVRVDPAGIVRLG
jgi:thiamine transport system ATP-binding protein